MSVERTSYVIAGYDLTEYVTDKYDEWRWTYEGEEYVCNQIKDYIQLFDDPLNGEYLYLGYIFANIENWDGFNTEIINPEKIYDVMPDVAQKLLDLESKGIISKCPKLRLDYKLIVFEEYK